MGVYIWTGTPRTTIAHRPLNSTSTTNDTSGNGHNLTNSGGSFGTYGGVSCYSCPPGNYYLKGNIGDITSYSHTISLWAYKIGGVEAGNLTVFQFGKGQDSQKGKTEGVQRPSYIRNFYWFDDLDTQTTYATEGWHNIVTCFDKENSKQIMYVDGVKIGERTTTYTHGPLYYTNDFYLLGGLGSENSYNVRFKMFGYISELIIEDAVWSTSDALDYYNSTKSAYNWQRSLPSAYQEVTYIQSSGTQYIDTGFKPTQNTIVRLSMGGRTSSVGQFANLFGGRQEYSANGKGFLVGYDRVYSTTFSMFGASLYMPSESSPNFYDGSDHIVHLAYYGLYVDGVSKITPGSTSFTCPVNMTIFADNDNGTVNEPSSYKLYSFRIWDSGTLIRDFVPCYRKNDSVIGLYDLANNQFYTNAGTGTFTKGSDV